MSRKLFLSKRIVLEHNLLDGGVLVSGGKIDKVLSRDECTLLLVSNEDVLVTDVGDSVLMAGIVDSHVHVNEPGRTHWEGFRTATSAAAAGGVTTLVDMPLNSVPPTTSVDNLRAKTSAANGNVYIDVGFWGGVIPGNTGELREMVKEGVVGFKCFLCPSGVDEFPNVSKDDIQKALSTLEGTGSVLAFHAELEDTGKNQDISDPTKYETYLISRPDSMEVAAIKLISELALGTTVRIHIVHVSSADCVPLLEELRRMRGGVTAETCHHYLSLSAESIPAGHTQFKCAPPIRSKENQNQLWNYLKQDQINLVVSDHSPCTADLKNTNFMSSWGGISSLQYGLSLFWTGAKERSFTLNDMAKYLCEAPARLCGLENKKGSIKPGLDADFVVFDPEASYLVRSEDIRFKNKSGCLSEILQLHKSVPHAVVAVSRYTDRGVYYTDCREDNALARLISRADTATENAIRDYNLKMAISSRDSLVIEALVETGRKARCS